MNYRSYGYHCSGHVTKPRNSSFNIKGLELEISDFDSGWLLDELVEENILTVPDNERTEKEFDIAVENDGSVFKELIFKASSNRTLLKGVRKLSNKLHGNIDNGRGTSCHIHYNNRYLDNIGLDSLDVTKSAEFLAPILFKISGRSSGTVSDWCKSVIRHSVKIDDVDLLKRCKPVDDIDSIDYARYRIINVNPMNTTELRIFSNYYAFDYDYIKMYLETADFILDLAQVMKNKSYEEEYNNIIEMCKNFFGKRKYKNIWDRHGLDIFFKSKKERKLITLENKKQYILNMFNAFSNGVYMNELNRQMELIRILRSINARYSLPDIRINLSRDGVNEELILEQIIQDINREFIRVESEEDE